jgi:stress response protein YsnF
VLKEEIRVRKNVVEDEQAVEEDVHKEEVDVEDQSITHGRGRDVNLDHEAGRRVR